MTDSFRVTFKMTAQVLSDAAGLHLAAFMAKFRTVMAIVGLAGIVLAIAINRPIGVGIAVFGILMLAMTWATFLDRWIYRTRGRGVIGETCEYVVDDSGLHYAHPLGSGEISWSALTHVRADDKSIVFGRDRVLAAYIPTSAFATPAERDAFLAFARAHVGRAVVRDDSS